MSNEWNEFLVQRGAIVGHGIPTQFPGPALGDNAAWCDLSYRGLISARGSEAQAFLARQFSSDILQLAKGQSQLSGYCSPKGRLLAIFRAFIHDDAICLELPRALLETTLKRLRMFILRSDVVLEDSSDTLARIGFVGEDAGSLWEGFTRLTISGNMPRTQVIGTPNDLKQRLQNLPPIDSQFWEHQDVLAGIPIIMPQTSELFVPQMVNLHLVGGVSFTKGCYPGQEIVARTQYLGTLKRRMYVLHCDETDIPAPGEAIFSAANSDQKAGVVVHAEASASGTDLLAVLEIQAADAGNLHLVTPSGPALTFLQLPYSYNG